MTRFLPEKNGVQLMIITGYNNDLAPQDGWLLLIVSLLSDSSLCSLIFMLRPWRATFCL